ncbi:MAG: acyltransferase domain-containing protein, partial [Chloroflexales bacterium]|nr:acyltransferase domain-containing protein [Chloroflexales bacterium]
LAPDAEQVAIAAINGPANLVLSGARDALAAVLARLAAAGVASRPLQVSHAFHSPLMAPVQAAFAEAASRVRFQPPRLPLLSTLTGAPLGPGELPDAAYWGRQLREPVQFAAAVAALQRRGLPAWLELGPQPVLLGLARPLLADPAPRLIPSLQQGRDESQSMLTSLGALYTAGADIDWGGVAGAQRGRRLASLPTYPFQRQRYWVERSSQRPVLQEADLAPAEASPAPAAQRAEPYYEVAWRQQERPEGAGAESVSDGAWLIFAAAEDDIARALVERVRGRGAPCALVRPGQAFAALGPQEWTIDPAEISHFERVLQVARGEGRAWRGIVYLWGAAELPAPGASLLPTLQLSCGGALALAQALVGGGQSLPTRLWLVTRGAQAVAGWGGEPVQATLWGLGQTLAIEHPELRCRLVDLQSEPPGKAARALLDELCSSDAESRVALRGPARYVARLVPAAGAPARSDQGLIRADATYLITGGFGGLGLVAAEWLVARGARPLVLMGRRGA